MTWEPNYRPSNGTEGEMFRRGPRGCYSCQVDHDGGWHEGGDDGESCPILMAAIVGDDGPTEWEVRWWKEGDRRGFETRCTAWRGPCACTEGTDYDQMERGDIDDNLAGEHER